MKATRIRDMSSGSKKWVGANVKRKEDFRFLTGKETYVDNLTLPGTLYCAILRSPYAHAKIKSVDTSKARTALGVMAVITGEDTFQWFQQISHRKLTQQEASAIMPASALAQGKATFQGKPVAAVAASSRGEAEDALDLIDVDFDSLKPVVSFEQAMDPSSPRIFHGTDNFTPQIPLVYGDVDSEFRNAQHVVKGRFHVHRYSSTALDTKACIAHYEAATGRLTLIANAGHPTSMWRRLSGWLGIPPNKLRLIVPDIGGQFGNKSSTSIPDYAAITTLLSMKTGKPVKYVENRVESLMGEGQSGETILEVEAAFTGEGQVTALKITDYENEGASTDHLEYGSAYQATNKLGGITGPYRIKAVSMTGGTAITNQCPSVHNRAIGLPGMLFALERTMDIAAAKIGLDPAEIRMRNYIRLDEFPYLTPSGNLYDEGDYPTTLRQALEAVGYEELRNKQKEEWRRGRYIGIGISASVEPSAANPARHYVASEKYQRPLGSYSSASIKMDPSGKVILNIPSPFAGQGHETTAAQVAADELNITPDDIEVYAGFDSLLSPLSSRGTGGGNTFAVFHLGAVVKASRALKEKVKQIASKTLDAKPEDLELKDGKVVNKHDAARSMTLREVARIAYEDLLLMPEGVDPGLHIVSYYNYPYNAPVDEARRVKSHLTFGNAAHIAVVEVDPETGVIHVLKYMIVADSGVIINPAIVDGQIVGNALHGISAALGEGFIYDAEGQLLTSTFSDYLKPTSMEMVEPVLEHMVHPTSFSQTGAKGVGEGAAAIAPAAIANAVEDALQPLGVKISELMLTPEKMWSLIKTSRPTP
ncbi:MAG: xanthine dehydrogenase family protein molybdopterin-binding subunit [Thaumarchaeota archaeon]|nr:xanthine dehydrogenase family protein molybdopterin-binding subunit [Nitrososphaerota archaeon]